MKLDIVKFHFTTPLHIATPSADYGSSNDMVHSDTLWSAIVHTLAVMGEKIPENPEDCGFVNSSLFPFISTKENQVHFFPRPKIPLKIEEDISDISKKLKKAHWIDQKYLEKVLQNSKISKNELDNQIQGQYLSGEDVSSHFFSRDYEGGDHDIMARQTVPRIRVPRDHGDTTIFYMERIYFAPGAGLFAIFNFQNEEAKKKVLSALELLAEEGIGSDKNLGHGKFEYEVDSLEISFPSWEEATHATNVSLFCPESQSQLNTLMSGETGYDLTKRGGWISDEHFISFRKQSVFMFREGGIWQNNTKNTIGDRPVIQGQIKNVKPGDLDQINHEIYRNGKSLFLPAKLV